MQYGDTNWFGSSNIFSQFREQGLQVGTQPTIPLVDAQTEEQRLQQAELDRRQAALDLEHTWAQQQQGYLEEQQKIVDEKARLTAIEAGNVDQLYYVIRRPGQGCIGMWLTTNEAQQRGLDPAQGSKVYYDPNPMGRPIGGRALQREVPFPLAIIGNLPLYAGLAAIGIWYWWRYR